LKTRISFTQSHIRARILGSILIVIGVIFLVNPTSLNIKIGFVSIFTGIFMIFMITEKSIHEKISDTQVEINLDTVEKILKDLKLKGNAVFLPKSDILNEERILIPPNESGVIKIPNATHDFLLLTGKDREKLGIFIPPAGLKLLNEIDKEGHFENAGIENIEERLQIFIGLNLLKSVSLRKIQNGWNLIIEKPLFCNNNPNLHKQFPCPVSSAIITAITRSLNQKLRIYNVTQNRGKIEFHLNIIKLRNNGE